MAAYAYLFPWMIKYISDSKFTWCERFAWFPHRSHKSGQRIWFKKAWYGYRLIHGPAGEEPVRAERWLTEQEYFIQCLTQ